MKKSNLTVITAITTRFAFGIVLFQANTAAAICRQQHQKNR